MSACPDLRVPYQNSLGVVKQDISVHTIQILEATQHLSILTFRIASQSKGLIMRQASDRIPFKDTLCRLQTAQRRALTLEKRIRHEQTRTSN